MSFPPCGHVHESVLNVISQTLIYDHHAKLTILKLIRLFVYKIRDLNSKTI